MAAYQPNLVGAQVFAADGVFVVWEAAAREVTVKRDVCVCSFAAAEVVVLGMAPRARVAEALAICGTRFHRHGP